jgi:acetylornithine deacetylase/succinyl-diaminopimelate desuccinylase-like protein
MSFPTVSAQPAHAPDMARCAAWLAAHLRRIGLTDARVAQTGGHPAVVASWRQRPGRPTVLVYGHYDVQPAEPLKEWRTPPFQPTVRGDNLYGRGASDDKGQLFAHVVALQRALAAGGPPVNVVIVVDGEEEIGSPNLARLLTRRRQALHADVAVISDTRMLGPDRPAIVYALRGAVNSELTVTGPARDLHSGIFGGAVANPASALCHIVSTLHDERGRVAVRGFYDAVRPVSRRERAELAASAPRAGELLGTARVDPWGEPGYSAYERTVLRPCLTVTGMSAGYVGPGTKSIVPSRASVRLNLRLVADQEPAEVAELLRGHVAAVVPPGVRARLRTVPGARPVVVDRAHPGMRAASAACERAFGTAPAFLRSGGTIRAVALLRDVLGLPAVLMGFGLPDDNIHAPNEKTHLPTFERSVGACQEFLARIASAESHNIRSSGNG